MATCEEVLEEAVPPGSPTINDVNSYNDRVFTEPNTEFKGLLSRWHKLDETNKDVVRLPGIKGKDHGHKKKVKKEHSSLSRPSSPTEKKKKKKHCDNLPLTPEPIAESAKEEEEEEKGPPETEKPKKSKNTKTKDKLDANEKDANHKVRKPNRADLKEQFEKSNPSLHIKKKVLRQPANLYQVAPEFTKDFKPPKFAKTEEEEHLIKKALRKNFVFADLTSKELKPLIGAFEPCSFETGNVIIKQGDSGDYFYIIQKGRVLFQVNGVDVGKAGKGSSFGELALLYTCPRAATVVAAKSTKVFRVDQATFQFILQNVTAQSEKDKLELLRAVNFLKDLDNQHLKKLTKVMTPKIFSKDDVVVRKGDPGDAFYVIQEGTVLVQDISVGHSTFENLELGPGDYFGERALVTSEPRAANVVGKTHGVAFSIDRKTFEKVLGGMEALVIKAQDARLLSGMTFFRKAEFSGDVYAHLADLISDSSFGKGHSIIKEGDTVPAALYLVREGEVTVTKQGGSSESFHTGEFFGQEALLKGAETNQTRIKAPFSILASSDCVVGVLSLADCKHIFDTTLLTDKKRAPSYTLTKDELKDVAPPKPQANIKLEDLNKETILGAGTFGQVWLVRGTDEDTGQEKPYALKIQAKYGLYEEGQISAVIREKQLLLELNHPFIVNLVATYQDKTCVYFLTEFVQGGELFSVIHREEGSGMKEQEAKFYALGIADVLSHLHSKKIVYRDMKPENVLIDGAGYPKLIDFGFAKYCPEKTFTFCGTPGYVSPEIITKRGHDCTADNWSFGVLLYEMLSGENPFYFEGMDQISLFRSIVEDDFLPLTNVSEEARDIVTGLLVKDSSMRLGSSKQQGFVVTHKWFADMDLDAMRNHEVTPPWVPEYSDPYDAINFDDWGDLVHKSAEVFLSLPAKHEMRFWEEF